MTMVSYDLGTLNKQYKKLTPEERLVTLNREFTDIIYTSSFGTTAVYLLHLFHRQGVKQPVHFINTTYHFDETIRYKVLLTALFDLQIIEVLPEEKHNVFSKEAELWLYDPDMCCRINKTDTIDGTKNNFKVWVLGLMNWQNEHREKLEIFEMTNGILHFHPIIDVTEKTVVEYIQDNRLPEHPLKLLGYESIGCKHCTIKGMQRHGRWPKQVKNECGLHL